MITTRQTTLEDLYELINMEELEERDKNWGKEILLAEETPAVTILNNGEPALIAACAFNSHFGEYELGLIVGEGCLASPRAILEGAQQALKLYRGNEQGYCISLCDPRFPTHSRFLKHFGLRYRENVLLHGVTLEVWILDGWWNNRSTAGSR